MTEDFSDPKATLLSYLSRERATVLWKLHGLSDYDLRRPLTPTGTNLLGVVKHLAMVELGYFGEVFGRAPQVSVSWWADDEAAMESVPNIDMYAAATQTRDQVVTLYEEAGDNTAATVAALDLDSPGLVPWWGDQGRVTLQRIMVHMLDETARHAGHLDIVRELIDGQAGHRSYSSNLPEDGAEFWAGYLGTLQSIADGFRRAR